MTNQQILETLSNCIEIAKTTDNYYTVNKLTEIAEALINNNNRKQAVTMLKNAGYYADNLWHVMDVQLIRECTETEAYKILDKVMTSGWIMEQIKDSIRDES